MKRGNNLYVGAASFSTTIRVYSLTLRQSQSPIFSHFRLLVIESRPLLHPPLEQVVAV